MLSSRPKEEGGGDTTGVGMVGTANNLERGMDVEREMAKAREEGGGRSNYASQNTPSTSNARPTVGPVTVL